MNWLMLSVVDGPLTPHDLWSAWSFEPVILILIACTTLLYARGMWNTARAAGAGWATPKRRWLIFLAAMLSLGIALVSPLDALSGALFSAHMVQHLILMMITAPLLVLSELPVAIVRAMPRGWAQGLGHGLNRPGALSRIWAALLTPVSAWLLFAASMWVWHASTLYDAALRNEAIHTLEHLGFVLTSMLFWWVLFRRTTAEHVHYGMLILYLFTTMLHSTVLGALMAFTSLPWYPYYAASVSAWGLTPLEDQQLAGLIMWVPGGIVFTLLTIGYFAAWFRAVERRSMQLQQRGAVSARQKID